MGFTLVTAPAAPLISAAEAKARLRIDVATSDSDLALMIGAATGELDGPTGMLFRALVTQTWKYAFDEFPDRAIRVPLPPLQSVGAVKYLDLDGVQRTLAPAAYRVVIDTSPGLIEPAYGTVWPSTRDVASAVEITFTAGYGATADKVPDLIRHYALLRVADADANREAVVQGSSISMVQHPWIDSMLINLKNVTSSP